MVFYVMAEVDGIFPDFVIFGAMRLIFPSINANKI
jgi:hypothetical protein